MITLQWWVVLIMVGAVWVLIVSGVLIGAWFVFRSKRESHERFFPGLSGEDKGEVFTIPDGLSEDNEDLPPNPIIDRMNKLLRGRLEGQSGLEDEQ